MLEVRLQRNKDTDQHSKAGKRKGSTVTLGSLLRYSVHTKAGPSSKAGGLTKLLSAEPGITAKESKTTQTNEQTSRRDDGWEVFTLSRACRCSWPWNTCNQEPAILNTKRFSMEAENEVWALMCCHRHHFLKHKNQTRLLNVSWACYWCAMASFPCIRFRSSPPFLFIPYFTFSVSWIEEMV